MKARYSNNRVSQSRPATVSNRGNPSWAVIPGILFAEIGFFLIGLAGWYALGTGSQSLLYSGGGIFCLAGLFLVWKGTVKRADAAYVLAHRLANNGDVVAFKMGRRQGAKREHI
jgi:hypothetical protein